MLKDLIININNKKEKFNLKEKLINIINNKNINDLQENFIVNDLFDNLDFPFVLDKIEKYLEPPTIKHIINTSLLFLNISNDIKNFIRLILKDILIEEDDEDENENEENLEQIESNDNLDINKKIKFLNYKVSGNMKKLLLNKEELKINENLYEELSSQELKKLKIINILENYNENFFNKRNRFDVLFEYQEKINKNNNLNILKSRLLFICENETNHDKINKEDLMIKLENLNYFISFNKIIHKNNFSQYIEEIANTVFVYDIVSILNNYKINNFKTIRKTIEIEQRINFLTDYMNEIFPLIELKFENNIFKFKNKNNNFYLENDVINKLTLLNIIYKNPNYNIFNLFFTKIINDFPSFDHSRDNLITFFYLIIKLNYIEDIGNIINFFNYGD